MEPSTFLPQHVDYLGFLRSQLNGLQGIPTLCYELIQNADDVKDEQGNPGASWISFDVCDDALWVENDGVFREIDFERMQKISWGNKREEADTIGAFGIGFISVYQITDAPELFSSGRHWKFYPASPDPNKRIEEKRVPTERTRFRLPWALDVSQVRLELGIQPVERERIPQFVQEIYKAVKHACLFLKQIRVLEVKRSGNLFRRIETSYEGNQILLQDGDKVEVWTIFEGDFSQKASILRSKYWGVIEDKKRTSVQIAVPDSPDLDGCLYAFLPSETNTQLPFHINADFYPTPDRKRILFDHSPKGEWNRCAIECAIEILAQHIPDLVNLFPPQKFWEFLRRVNLGSKSSTIDASFTRFWDRAKQSVMQTPCVPAVNTPQRYTPPETIFLITEAQVKSAHILSELGLSVVDPSLRAFQNLLLECKVRKLNLSDIIRFFEEKELCQTVSLTRMPKSLQSPEEWEVFWSLLEDLSKQQAQISPQLKKLAIAFGSDGNLWIPSKMVRTDEATQHLFTTIAPEQVWFDPRGHQGDLPGQLIKEFSLNDAINLLKTHIRRIQQLWGEEKFPIKELYEWLENRKGDITDEIKQQLRHLPIWPAADGNLHTLHSLYLPGDFQDPLGLTQLVDLKALGGKREFLETTLGVERLDFANYVSEYVPSKIQNEQLPSQTKVELLCVLAENLGKIQEDETIRNKLVNLPIIWCGEDRFEKAENCYFENEEIRQVLGEDVVFAKVPGKKQEAVKSLYEWLGVATSPRVRDLLGRIKQIIQREPDEESIQKIEKIFEFIASQWETWDDRCRNQFSELKDLPWLPGTKKPEWQKPREVYSDFQKYLFESQGNFLKFSHKVQQKGSKFLDFLGVGSTPTPRQVVNHLIYCSENGKEINVQVYSFLDQNTSDPAIGGLEEKPCLYLPNGQHIRPQDVFWEEHPFGDFRHTLGPDWRKYQNLLDRLGVKNKPNGHDAIRVLLEIAEKFGNTHKPLTGENEVVETIVLQCWKILSAEYDEGKIGDSEIRNTVGKAKTIPDNRHVLTLPEYILLEDRPNLKEKFPRLEHNLIELPQGAWHAMEAAGAQRFSKVVEVNILDIKNPTRYYDLEGILQERISAIYRIIEMEKTNGINRIDANSLQNLEIFEAEKIQVLYRLRAFLNDQSSPEEVKAITQGDGRLYFSKSGGDIPWPDIARELARIMYPEGDLPNLALGLKEILRSSSIEEVNYTFDQMGYPRVKETKNQPESKPPVSVGGVEELVDLNGETQVTQSKDVGFDNEAFPVREGRSNKDREFTRDGSEKRRRTRLVSYVIPSEKLEQVGDDTTDKRDEVSQTGIQHVIIYEKENGRNAVDLNTDIMNHPGYDIESTDKNGEIRYIEVKALSGIWEGANPARLTRNEYETARKYGKQYWLYVVENISSGSPNIYCIQDPAGKVNYYLFDHGWIGVAEEK